jgi:hypothetical protein
MGESAIKFRLRDLFILMTVVAVLICGGIWFLDSFGKADRAAVRAAYMDGRLTREQARYDAGPEVDQWPEPTPKSHHSK